MKKVIFGIFVVISILAIYGCTRSDNTDALKFKEEYESLNNKINPNNKKQYPSVSIKEDNVVKYATVDEIVEVLDNGTGVIYFGYPECPWCRNAVPVLLEAANELGIESIYYMNLKEERDQITVNEDGSLEVVTEGTEAYKKLLASLDSVLDDYILEDVYGNQVNTNEKRIYVPLVIFVYQGEIVGVHGDTVESQTDPYELLNEEQKNELMDIYIDFMHKVLNDVCDTKC